MSNFYVRSTDGVDTDNGTTWALAEATAAAGITDSTNADTCWLSQVHAESVAGIITITGPTSIGLRVLCGNDGAEPPTVLAATASITATGNQINISGFLYWYGLTFNSGATTSPGIGIAQAPSIASHQSLENCQFFLSGNGASSVSLGPPTGGGHNCRVDILGGSLATFRFSNTGQFINPRYGRISLTAVTIDGSSSAAPTTLFKFTTGDPAIVRVTASDLTGKTWTNLVDVSADTTSEIWFEGCKFPASFTPTTGTRVAPGGPRVYIERCNNGDVQNYFYYDFYEGTSELNTTIYRTAGAQDDDSIHFSCKMISTANTKFWAPLRSPKFAIPITAVGSSKTVTCYLAVDASAPTLTNANVWLEIIEYTTSGVPLGVVGTSRPADVLAAGTNLTNGSEAWTGLGGTNAKFEIALSFTPQEKGIYTAQLCIAEASRTLFVDFAPLVA